jgi:hypothetical protein
MKDGGTDDPKGRNLKAEDIIGPKVATFEIPSTELRETSARKAA